MFLLRCSHVVSLSLALVFVAVVPFQAQNPDLRRPPFASKCSSSLSGGTIATSLTPLEGETLPNDPDGNIKWVSKADQEPGREWQVNHTVTNRDRVLNVHVDWHPNVLETWIRPNEWRGSGAFAGLSPPRAQQGEIEYGKNGKKRADSYQSRSTESTRSPLQSIIHVSLTILLNNNQYRDVTLVARSRAVPKGDAVTFDYCIEIDPKQADLTKLLILEWTAAASPQFANALRAKHGEPFIHLPEKEPAVYEGISGAASTLRAGALIINDRDKRRLAAAYAPAYGPPQ